jgi:Formyl transferase
MPRWLASFSDLAGILMIDEPRGHRFGKLRKSIARDGLWRTIDLLAFRAYQRCFLASQDQQFERLVRDEAQQKYAPPPAIPMLTVASPNSPQAEEFLWSLQPDVVLACCKHLLKPRIFEIPAHGTFVMHPGICPEYRNAHGCFWALVNGDMERVGMTLLRIDRGIDTGPVFGHFRAPYHETEDTPLMIQRRMTYNNLDEVGQTLQRVVAGIAVPISTLGRKSAVWGQPTLTAYWKWKQLARKRPETIPLPSAVQEPIGVNSPE